EATRQAPNSWRSKSQIDELDAIAFVCERPAPGQAIALTQTVCARGGGEAKAIRAPSLSISNVKISAGNFSYFIAEQPRHLGRNCGDSSVCPARRNHMPNNNQSQTKRGFASMDEDKQREAASRGGQQ